MLLIGEEGKRHYVLIYDFSTFMYGIHYIVEENIFEMLKEILKRHIKDCFKTTGKQRIDIPEKSEYVKKLKILKKKKIKITIYYLS